MSSFIKEFYRKFPFVMGHWNMSQQREAERKKSIWPGKIRLIVQKITINPCKTDRFLWYDEPFVLKIVSRQTHQIQRLLSHKFIWFSIMDLCTCHDQISLLCSTILFGWFIGLYLYILYLNVLVYTLNSY